MSDFKLKPKIIKPYDSYSLLMEVREACLFSGDAGIEVTTEPHISEELFDRICSVLNSVAEPAKEVQPSVQFEDWWDASDRATREGYATSPEEIARAAWQAALAAQSGEIERLKKAAELHNDSAVESWQLTRKWQKRVFELEAELAAANSRLRRYGYIK